MNGRVRLKLVGGIVLVVALCAGLVLVLDDRNARVDSASAQLAADEVPVGSAYSGTIVRQLVQLGDVVQVDQPLFEISSSTLQSDLTSGLVDPRTTPFTVTANRTMMLTATEPGQVDAISYTEGAFVPANSAVAALRRAGSLYVRAEFRLSPQDYARVAPDAEIEVQLPSRAAITARARTIRVETVGGEAATTVEAYSPELTEASAGGLFAPGTPVTAELRLRNDGVVGRLSEFVLGP